MVASFSHGRRGQGAAWFYYNPWARLVACSPVVRTYCGSGGRPILDGHYQGCDPNAVPDGCLQNPVVGVDNANCGGCSCDLPIDNSVVASGDVDEYKKDIGIASENTDSGSRVARPAGSGVYAVSRSLRQVGGVLENIVDKRT